MAYGGLLLVLIRKAIAARIVLLGSAVVIFALTLIYGTLAPLFTWGALSGIPFTFIAGTSLSVGLVALAKFASARLAAFSVCFLAVQCVLNALLDLKTVFFLSSPFAPSVPTDAVNMANATGVPALLWAIIWITLALAILGLAMRIYVVSRDSRIQPDLPFEEVS
jgi:hypothetical protein